ncbi:2TM domain-containing protein [Aquabacterium sp. OR-4]|uniref:2TM domain-containing protein n=1 Tax=Aquabacterium sp. OR-4 TaxID=2978127 RepID=UPI0021B1F70D|nr:2TM domain-containing protein [Aquabacterium sp. OR-4]MDT7833572.1 2TM domain-containing protein [Aquabacterium sp. OR-4]
MNPLHLITQPLSDLGRAVLLPFKALFVVGLCFAINAMTTPGHWWVKWVALGMGIAVLVAWAKALRTLIVIGLLAAVGLWVHRRYGAEARARFDEWAQRTQPGRSQLLAVLRGVPGVAR